MAVTMIRPQNCCRLYEEIGQKLASKDSSSGSVKLFNKGKTAVFKKLAEEAAEVWMAVRFESQDELALEISQVWYYLILLSFYYPEDQSEFCIFLGEADKQLLASDPSGNLSKSLVHTCVELIRDENFLSHSKTIFTLSSEIARQNKVSLADIHSKL